MSKTITTEGNTSERTVSIEALASEASAIELHNEMPKEAMFDEEAFFNEHITIRIPPSAIEGDLPYVCVTVNGVNCFIPRGIPAPVRRKYVEALANARTDMYRQSSPNPFDPTDRPLTITSGFSYDFQVVEDKNPRGRAWLENKLAQG